MPIYSYKCNDCDYEFEQRQRMADAPLADCPSCHTPNSLRKVVNSVGIVFKGSGFYVTDSRNGKTASLATNGKSEQAAAAETAEPAKSEKGGDTAKANGTAAAATGSAASANGDSAKGDIAASKNQTPKKKADVSA